MARIFNSIMLVLAKATSANLRRQILFLKAENEALREGLPKGFRVSAKHKAKLVKLGKPLGTALASIITVVTYRTFLNWCRQTSKSAKAKRRQKRGRPLVAEELELLVLMLADELQCGYTRVLAELKKLGTRAVARNTVKNILLRNGIDPGPKTGKGTWDDFIKLHQTTLWACDFIVKKVVTRIGLLDCFVFFAINVGSRKVKVTGVTIHPNDAWMAQQARNLAMHWSDLGQKPTYLIKDGDPKITAHFGAILESEGVTVKRLPPYSPNLNAYAERWVQSFKSECLDNFIVLGEDHLRYICTQYESYYNTVRPHQSKDNAPLGMKLPEPTDEPISLSQVKCKTWLGGLLKHYYREAA
jgi:putative transposase